MKRALYNNNNNNNNNNNIKFTTTCRLCPLRDFKFQLTFDQKHNFRNFSDEPDWSEKDGESCVFWSIVSTLDLKSRRGSL